MKFLFLFLIAINSLQALCQNVGINKTSPLHPLDINGNLNVDGKILVNGTSGLSGQVLSTNGVGATAWGNIDGFKQVINFTQSASWTVPAGVTKIMIEMWGAGGGGSTGGGGAGGMYVMSVADVTPGASISIVVGAKGAKASCATCGAQQGAATTVTSSSINLSAVGGYGGGTTTPGYASKYGTSGGYYFQMPGQNGDANTFSYQQKNSTVYVILRKYGDGGATGPNYTLRSQGQTVSFNESTGTQIDSNDPSYAPFPGGGGGGGLSAEDGADGMVVIRF